MPKRRVAGAPAQGDCELALPADKGARLTTSLSFYAYAAWSTHMSSREHDASVATRAFPVASRSILA
jgi:hypothetical protein